MKEKEGLSDCQMSYLSLIQGVINRMASCCATVKGFAATIFAGVLAIVISGKTEQQFLAIIIAIVAIIIATIFDLFYFYSERQYRNLYNEVRSGEHPCDFELNVPKYGHITRLNSLKSFSLWAYYGSLEAMLIVALICLAI